MTAEQTFRADVTFHAQVSGAEHPLTLIVANGADGWLGAVYYPDTKESINVCQVAEIADARANVEGWVRTVHGVKGAIKWAPGTYSLRETRANATC